MLLRLKLLLCLTGADILFAILLGVVGSLGYAFLMLGLAWVCWNTVILCEAHLKENETNGE